MNNENNYTYNENNYTYNENNYTYTLILNEQLENLMKELRAKGYYDDADIFRSAVRMLHKKEFPAYQIEKKRKSEIPNLEEDCIKKGGEVVIHEGIRQCKTIEGAIIHYQPL